MVSALKVVTAGLVTLQVVVGAPAIATETNVAIAPRQETSTTITSAQKNNLIDELIDECDLEDADRFLNGRLSDFFKKRF
ncbi:MAG: hypothetical protein CVU84_05770 [Firmicutes bacterium HGW-Firmicutes-1]|jgi:hypothetical protein|nr:MAG: hypothetical protein CVU84_05770 [Firmicutes bacterium HGW-Firmicutes-1]